MAKRITYRAPHLGLSDKEIRSFAMPLSEYLPTEVVTNDEFLHSVAMEIEDLDQLANREVCETRVRELRLKAKPDQVSERVILREDGRVALAGVRFKALDSTHPFIELNLNFRPLEDLDDIAALVRSEFALVEPRGFLLREAPEFQPRGAVKWSHVLWGETGQAEIELSDKFYLQKETDTGFYDFYRTEYETWRTRNVALRPFIKIEAEADLKRASAKGLVYSLYDDKGWAGLVAGQESAFFGLQCVYIFELFLTERQRGRGLAKKLEGLFLNKVKPSFDFVYGTINDRNLPSLKTALSVGRKVVQTEFYLPL